MRREKLKNRNKKLKNLTVTSNDKNKLIINITYKNKMKTYCVKFKKGTENIDPKIEQKIVDQLCNQNILFVELKNQDL